MVGALYEVPFFMSLMMSVHRLVEEADGLNGLNFNLNGKCHVSCQTVSIEFMRDMLF